MLNNKVPPTESPERRSRSCASPSQTSMGPYPHKPNPGKSARKSSSLPAETVDYLKAWMMSPEHIAHPYPTEQEKTQIMAETGIEQKQLTNWFVNNRKRFWKPRVEARLQKQAHLNLTASSPSPILHLVGPNNRTNKQNFTPQPSDTPFITLDMTQPAPTIGTTSPVSFVTSSSLDQFLDAGKPRAVSVTSSTSSISGSESSSFYNETDEDLNSDVVDEVDSIHGIVKRNETIDVHILRPTGGNQKPSLEDVSVLSSIPESRIIQTYKNCVMTYRFSQDVASDKKKIQSRRDAEVVRIKKQYLKKFLDELSHVDGRCEEEFSRKRSRDQADIAELRRPKYQHKCTKVWREACLTAHDGYDMELPSLEEAAHLFGY